MLVKLKFGGAPLHCSKFARWLHKVCTNFAIHQQLDSIKIKFKLSSSQEPSQCLFVENLWFCVNKWPEEVLIKANLSIQKIQPPLFLHWAPPLVIYEHKIRGPLSSTILSTHIISSCYCNCILIMFVYTYNFIINSFEKWHQGSLLAQTIDILLQAFDLFNLHQAIYKQDWLTIRKTYYLYPSGLRPNECERESW